MAHDVWINFHSFCLCGSSRSTLVVFNKFQLSSIVSSMTYSTSDILSLTSFICRSMRQIKLTLKLVNQVPESTFTLM